MADQKIIAGTLQVDTSQVPAASKTIKQLKDDVAALRKELENAAGGSPGQVAAYKSLTDAQEELRKATGGLNLTTAESTGAFDKLKATLGATSGPANAAAESVSGLGESLKALLANPVALVITAIVVALSLLYKAFTNTFEGGQKVEQVFAGLKAVGQSILDTLSDLAGALGKLFKGDFTGAAKQAGEAIANVGTNASKAFGQMKTLTDQAQQLAREQAENELDQVKRQAKLAELRAQAYDDSVPIAKRKAALQDLQKASEENAKTDIDLAKRVAQNSIDQLTVEREGADKNFIEIQKIKSEQLKGEIENSNEQRAIGRQLTQINKQELEQRKQDEAKALEERKKQQENYNAFLTQLDKLREDAASQGETDPATKEKKLLANQITDQQRAFDIQLQQAKINQEQYNELSEALAEDAHAKRQALDKKFADQDQKSETDFQNALAQLSTKIKLDAVTDQFNKERLQNQIGYEKELDAAKKQYANNAIQLAAYKSKLDQDLQAQQDKVNEKEAADKAKKAFDALKKITQGTLDDPMSSFKDKKAALDADVKANQDAYNAKTITEDEYLDNSKKNTAAQIALNKAKLESELDTANKIGDALGSLAELVGKQTAAGKALAIAQATIATFSGAVKAFDSLATIPIVGPALGALAAAGAIAAGIANVKKIVAVQVPGQGAGSSGTPSVSGSVPASPVAPTQQSTFINQAQIDTVSNAAAGGVNHRAYVLSGDVANDRDRENRLSRASKLGG